MAPASILKASDADLSPSHGHLSGSVFRCPLQPLTPPHILNPKSPQATSPPHTHPGPPNAPHTYHLKPLHASHLPHPQPPHTPYTLGPFSTTPQTSHTSCPHYISNPQFPHAPHSHPVPPNMGGPQEGRRGRRQAGQVLTL